MNRPEFQDDSKVKPPIGTYITSDREASLFHRLPGFSGKGFSGDVEDAIIQDLSAGLRSGKWPTQRNLTHIGEAGRE